MAIEQAVQKTEERMAAREGGASKTSDEGRQDSVIGRMSSAGSSFDSIDRLGGGFSDQGI